MMKNLRIFLSCSALALAQSACSSGQSFEKSLDDMWQWDGGVEASRVQSRLKNAKLVQDVPAAVGVTGRGLVGRALPNGKLWTYEGTVDVLPTLVGDAVLFSGDGVVTMLDVRTGVKRYQVDVGGRRLEGAGYDGTHALLLLVDTDDAREDQLLAVGPRGAKGLSVNAMSRLGTPSVVDGVGLVPYSSQYVGAVDLLNGELIGRVLLRDGLNRVRTENGGIVLYGAGATALSEDLTSSPDSTSLKLAPRKLPGDPVWPVDGSKPRPARAQPVGLYAEPVTEEGSWKFSDGAYAATYFEVALGLDHGSNQVRWVTHFKRAVAGGDSSPTGPTLCLEDGTIFQVSIKDGTTVPYGSLETRLKGCVVNATDARIDDGHRPALLAQIVDAISTTGPDMAAIKQVLLEEVGQGKGIETTVALLDIAQDPLVSSDLAKRAGTYLSKQNHGAAQMIEALRDAAPRKTEDALTAPVTPEATIKESKQPATDPPGTDQPSPKRRPNRRAPPVEALAQALSRMKAPGAAAALVPYLNDPSQSAQSVKEIMRAVLSLGDESQVEEVFAFLLNYKNTGGEDALIDALALAVQFLRQHGTEEQKAKLEASLEQSLTVPELLGRLEATKQAGERVKKEPDGASSSGEAHQ